MTSTPLLEPRRRNPRKARRQEAIAGLLFIAPLFAGVTVLNFYPIVRNTYLSLTKTGVFTGETFIWLDQYIKLFQDPQMWQAVLNTLLYGVIGLLGIPISVVIAGLLNRPGLRFQSGYRVLYFLPVVTMPVAIAMIWKLLYNGDYGLINQFLGIFGAPNIQWLTDPRFVIAAIGLVGVWASIGHHVVLILAGLQGVPDELLEAATLDGASPMRRFFSISVPITSPTIFLVSVLTVIGSLQTFDLVFIMMGPANPAIESAQTIVYYFYEHGVILHDRGYAAAIVTILLLLTMSLTAVQFALQKRWVHYES
ncbi:multiple sugar transport system permease protein [Arthrobacter sp. AG258]|uniref:carbohydrate ABC transporter permease n=1 Tax=Arthrobacter sp. AG258 TaxID=2183899 RepID=UPI0010603FD4|nr:sugar ABC transporter permease [Arthrobacter sp. AG258]TDT74704.1 multiple sugar transport system permease protein [Arthrobacter sp. AG258]